MLAGNVFHHITVYSIAFWAKTLNYIPHFCNISWCSNNFLNHNVKKWYFLSWIEVYSHLNNAIISNCITGGMHVHMVCTQKTEDKKYNFLTVIFVIRLSDFVKNCLFRACFQKRTIPVLFYQRQNCVKHYYIDWTPQYEHTKGFNILWELRR
jgi:hypothetical protein